MHADEGGAAERLRRHPRLRKRAPAACTPRVLGFALCCVEPLEALGIDPVVGPGG